MSDSESRLDLLQRALDAFVAWQEDARGRSAEQFLAEHDDLRSLLEPMVRPAEEDDSTEPAPPVAAGTRLGDYELLRLLGEGGMGRVFAARQQSLNRRVTIKVLNDALTETPAAIENFRREAAAAARLRHPGIVPIFEVGERAGVHFFVMEYVDGTPLDAALRDDALGALGSRARNERAAGILVEVAEALQYAHEQGLVHRDVKPHNLLVTGDGSVRLLDFGLASDRRRDEDHGDRRGFVGTPHYMSPEQAAGDEVGPASDVFSCGVVLYELLSGRRPFDGPSTTAVLSRITQAEAPALTGETPRELASICGRCLAKSPGDRYPTAAALATDLRAWLRHEPVAADPPGPARRALQYSRRHPARAVAIGLALTTALAMPVVWLQQNAVEIERREAAAASETAIGALRQLIAAIDDGLARRHELEPGYGRQIEAAIRLCADRLADPNVEAAQRRRLADALLTAAEIHPRLGDPRAALAPSAQAIDGLANDDDPAARATRARALGLRARLHQSLLDPEAATAAARAADEWRPLFDDATWQDTARAAVARLALLEAQLALEAIDGLDLAERKLADARALLESAPAPSEPAGAAAAGLTFAKLYVATGKLYLQRDDPAAAAQAFAAAAARLAEHDLAEDHPEQHAEQLLGAGTAALKLQQYDDAAAWFDQADAAIGKAADRFPSDANLQRTRAFAAQQRGHLLLQQRRHDDAITALEAASAAWEKLLSRAPRPLGRDAMALAVTCTQLGNCHLLRSPPDAAAAQPLYEKALDIQRQLHEAAPDLATHLTALGATHNNLAALQNTYGDPSNARLHALAAIELQQQARARRPNGGTIRTWLAMHHAQLAHAEHALDDVEAALVAARKAIELRPTHVGTVQICAQVAARIAAARPEAWTEEQTDALEAECVTWLHGLTRGSARNVAHLLRRPVFDPLRNREDFRQLEREVSR